MYYKKPQHGNDSILYASDFVGAFTRGASKEEAVLKMPIEIRRFQLWQNQDPFDNYEIDIVQEKESDLQIKDADSDVVLLYKATSFSGELHSSDEGEVWWEKYDNLRNLKLTSGFETYLKVYENDNLGELFYRRMDDGTWKEELK